MKTPDSSVLECPQVIEITSSAVQRCMGDLANVQALAESPLARLHFVQARGAGRNRNMLQAAGIGAQQVSPASYVAAVATILIIPVRELWHSDDIVLVDKIWGRRWRVAEPCFPGDRARQI